MNLKHVLQGKFLPHPLHPFVVHLPIGMWIGSFVFDALALYRGSGSRGAFWNQISTTCMLLGCIGALPAAITGLAEYVDTPRGSQVRNIATTHAGLNVSLLAGYIGQLLMRRNINHTQVSHLALNFLHVGVLAISGMLGKKMVFQYRMGARPLRRSVTHEETTAASTEPDLLRGTIDKLAGSPTATSQRLNSELAG